jgi:carbon-monoxide dehydrogenase small subunit
MLHEISFNVNNEPVTLAVKSHHTILKVLREQLGLTGTKIGCENGECGACTILLDGEAVNGCMVLAVEVDGRSVETVENLNKSGVLHPLQKAFVERNAIQCGFCTPGMLMMAKGLLEKNPHPDEEEVRKAIVGNLCRCTGYVRIVEAIMDASKEAA